MSPSFSRLIRFLTPSGSTHYGDAILPSGETDISKATHAHVITGDIFGSYVVTDQVREIRLLLAPLAIEDVKSVRCLGLNYEQHAKESNMPIPKYPVLFYKPPTSLSSPSSPIPIPPLAQSTPGLDYECELIIIISRPCTNIRPQDAHSYILGYCVGNDVSHREWQLARGGGQWALGKGFDGWAPYGPGIDLDKSEWEDGAGEFD
ncbi:fumarylacetoacetate hydrolase protein [Rutstroemia sp. NJR-2017a BBW]|nr:fumarylacetoacetate hydrolase protein [Rutstroemia sp. NJR-2017a BBW]